MTLILIKTTKKKSYCTALWVLRSLGYKAKHAGFLSYESRNKNKHNFQSGDIWQIWCSRFQIKQNVPFADAWFEHKIHPSSIRVLQKRSTVISQEARYHFNAPSIGLPGSNLGKISIPSWPSASQNFSNLLFPPALKQSAYYFIYQPHRHVSRIKFCKMLWK